MCQSIGVTPLARIELALPGTRATVRAGNALLEDSIVDMLVAAGWTCGPKAVITGARRCTILAVAPLPRPCAELVGRVINGGVQGGFCVDQLDDVALVADAARASLVALPERIRELAAQMPTVSRRQVEIVEALMAGRSNRQMSRDLALSTATVKRELSCISQAFGATNRLSICSTAYELGFRPRTTMAAG
jgi:DNA-binding CsgD family transcriptional regulator